MTEKSNDFMLIPHTLNLPTKSMSAALERRRQAVLSNPFRPKRCVVPWPEPTRKPPAPPPIPDNVLRFHK